jgi:hypothetical protein
MYSESTKQASRPLFLILPSRTLYTTFSPPYSIESSSQESRIILALYALKNCPCLTTRRVAKVYNVLYITLIDQRNG